MVPLTGPCYFSLCCRWLACGRDSGRLQRRLISRRLSSTAFANLADDVSLQLWKLEMQKRMLWLGVVAGTIPIGHHGTAATEHLHGGGHLGERTGQKPPESLL